MLPQRMSLGIAVAALMALGFIADAAPAAQVLLTGVEGWPNGRTVGENPPNAIDGDTNTFTWTTASFTTTVPEFLGVAFDSVGVGRIRLWKSNDGGGGANIKNLVIQYTTDTGVLDTRSWTTVTGLTSGFLATELFNATSVNPDGTVTGDVHNSVGGDGWGSLSFDAVLATGIRIAFQNPSASGFEHYRVGEFEVYSAELIPEPATLSLLGVALTAIARRRR